MKKIVVLSNMYPSEKHPTYGIFVKNQVEMLRNAEIDIDVIAIDEPGKGKLKTLMKYFSWFLRSFIHILKNKTIISATHAHYVFPTGLISLIAKKMMGIPYVVTVHGGDIDQMAKKSPWIKKMTTKILRQAETVIVVGEKLRSTVISEYAVLEERVKLISMGVDTSVFNRQPMTQSREKLGLSPDEKHILFVGNMIRAKGLKELVEAIGLVQKSEPNSALYLLGSQRDTNFIYELKNVIQEKEIKNIHFLQPQHQSDLALWMSAADVLALPSYHEGFGLVALEAMACGTPVVGSDVGGLSYLLNEGAGVLVAPQNVEALAIGITGVLSGEEGFIQQTRMEETVEMHTFETILKKLLLIYETMEKDK